MIAELLFFLKSLLSIKVNGSFSLHLWYRYFSIFWILISVWNCGSTCCWQSSRVYRRLVLGQICAQKSSKRSVSLFQFKITLFVLEFLLSFGSKLKFQSQIPHAVTSLIPIPILSVFSNINEKIQLQLKYHRPIKLYHQKAKYLYYLRWSSYVTLPHVFPTLSFLHNLIVHPSELGMLYSKFLQLSNNTTAITVADWTSFGNIDNNLLVSRIFKVSFQVNNPFWHL